MLRDVPLQVLKFIVYSSNGVSPVEPNPRFYEQMKEVRAPVDSTFNPWAWVH